MSSLVVLAFLVIVGIWTYLSGSLAASMTLFLAGWLGLQTWQLHQARMNGQLSQYPLFANAYKNGSGDGVPGRSSAQSQPASGAGGAPPPQLFQGPGVTLGKSGGAPPAGGACIGAIIAMAVSIAMVSQTSAPSE